MHEEYPKEMSGNVIDINAAIRSKKTASETKKTDESERRVQVYVHEPELTGTSFAAGIKTDWLARLIEENEEKRLSKAKQGEQIISECINTIYHSPEFKPLEDGIMNRLAYGAALNFIGQANGIEILNDDKKYMHYVVLVYKKDINEPGAIRHALIKDQKSLTEADLNLMSERIMKKDRSNFPETFQNAQIIPLFKDFGKE